MRRFRKVFLSIQANNVLKMAYKPVTVLPRPIKYVEMLP